MIITTITRTYSRSVNTKNISQKAPESWVKIVASYTADVESKDDPKAVSDAVHDMCRTDVTDGIKLLSSQIRAAFEPAPVAPPAQ